MEARCVRGRERGSGACFTRMRGRGCCRIKYIRVCECATTPVPRRDASAARAQGLSAAAAVARQWSARAADGTADQCNAGGTIISADGRPRACRAAADQSADAIADDTRRRPSPVNKLAAKPTGKPLRVRMRARRRGASWQARPSQWPSQRPRASRGIGPLCASCAAPARTLGPTTALPTGAADCFIRCIGWG